MSTFGVISPKEVPELSFAPGAYVELSVPFPHRGPLPISRAPTTFQRSYVGGLTDLFSFQVSLSEIKADDRVRALPTELPTSFLAGRDSNPRPLH